MRCILEQTFSNWVTNTVQKEVLWVFRNCHNFNNQMYSNCESALWCTTVLHKWPWLAGIIVDIVRSDARIIENAIECHNYTKLILKKKNNKKINKIATFVIGVATNNCGWAGLQQLCFLRQLWLVLRQLWSLATIVQIATIVITSWCNIEGHFYKELKKKFNI